MEWSKIKTILIWIFVIVNAFLFTVYLKGMYVDTTLEDTVVENTVSILASNNISVKKDIVPKIHANVKICNIENKYNSVADMIEDSKKIALQNEIDFFVEENIKVKGNTFTIEVNENKKTSKPYKYAKKSMKKTGLFENTEYSVREKDGYVYFYLEFDNKIFYDSYIRVKADEKGIQEIYGHNWLGDTITEVGLAETVSPAQILIDFATETGTDKKLTIVSAESGYYIGNRDETVRVTAFPVWEITLDNGEVYYYDMRNGDLLNGGRE